MKNIREEIVNQMSRPVKVLQFGGGNFLRAFVDYMIDCANERTEFNGSIVIVKSVSHKDLETFHHQRCMYTVSMRGLKNHQEFNENRIITSVSDVVDCTTQYESYAELAKNPTLRFIVSNTTEAGIVFDQTDQFEFMPPNTYPGKLTKFLYERYAYFNGDNKKGLIILPVELIDDNGKQLKDCVIRLSKQWQLPERFLLWLETACIFCSTLVDKIVTGFPKEGANIIWEELGYQDDLLVLAEPFGLWVIESEQEIGNELLLKQARLPVIFTKDQKPYKQRKVRILNGAHTSFVPAAFLCGYDYVRESLQDETIYDFMRQTIDHEIIPTLSLEKEDLISFADAVIDRFNNPYLKHALLSITLNSVSKWRARCLSSLTEYIARYHKLPLRLTFSLAALIAFYRKGYAIKEDTLLARRGDCVFEIKDDMKVLIFFMNHKESPNDLLVHDFLSNIQFFGQDLTAITHLEEETLRYLDAIETNGIHTVMEGFSEC